jgi:hypothetical protein
LLLNVRPALGAMRIADGGLKYTRSARIAALAEPPRQDQRDVMTSICSGS